MLILRKFRKERPQLESITSLSRDQSDCGFLVRFIIQSNLKHTHTYTHRVNSCGLKLQSVSSSARVSAIATTHTV